MCNVNSCTWKSHCCLHNALYNAFHWQVLARPNYLTFNHYIRNYRNRFVNSGAPFLLEGSKVEEQMLADTNWFLLQKGTCRSDHSGRRVFDAGQNHNKNQLCFICSPQPHLHIPKTRQHLQFIPWWRGLNTVSLISLVIIIKQWNTTSAMIWVCAIVFLNKRITPYCDLY